MWFVVDSKQAHGVVTREQLGYTHRKGLSHPWSQPAMEEAAEKKMSLPTAVRNHAQGAQGLQLWTG